MRVEYFFIDALNICFDLSPIVAGDVPSTCELSNDSNYCTPGGRGWLKAMGLEL